MRPSETPIDYGGSVTVYECLDCGEREEDAVRRVCRNCGGELRDIGLARDL